MARQKKVAVAAASIAVSASPAKKPRKDDAVAATPAKKPLGGKRSIPAKK